jgi:hypothetical protein
MIKNWGNNIRIYKIDVTKFSSGQGSILGIAVT